MEIEIVLELCDLEFCSEVLSKILSDLWHGDLRSRKTLRTMILFGFAQACQISTKPQVENLGCRYILRCYK